LFESLCRLTIEGFEENLEIKFTYDSAYPYIHSMKWWIFIALILFISPSFGQDERLEKKLEEAMRLSEQGQHLDAYAVLSGIIQDRPYLTEAYYYRSLVRDRAGDTEGALTDLNSLLELDPLHYDGIFLRGTMRYRLGQYALALEDFSSLLHIPPGPTQTIIYQRKGYQSGVSGVFTQQSGNNAHVFENIGLCQLALGEWREAKKSFDEAISLAPGTADYYLHRGRAFELAGDTARAKEDFMKALEINPYHPMAHQYLAALANATGDWESAEKFYDQAIEDQPDFALSYKQRGYQRLRAEKWTEALADFDKVLEIQPDDAEALKYKAYVLQKLKRADQALELYNRAIGLNPMDAQAYFSKGNILYQKQQYLDAVAAYTLALYYQPDLLQANYQRGLAYHYLGKKAEACRDLQKAAEAGLKQAVDAMAKICK
jgi:tetratricopeptide (TPR) repeat protein